MLTSSRFSSSRRTRFDWPGYRGSSRAAVWGEQQSVLTEFSRAEHIARCRGQKEYRARAGNDATRQRFDRGGKETLHDVPEAGLARWAQSHLSILSNFHPREDAALLDERQNGVRDERPILAEGNGNDRLEI